jgi:NADP-dependent 3-hydroxy acid dehydrogenase YdfG
MTATFTAELPPALPGHGLAGQVALVTGASRGLGRVIAGTLADAGAAVGLIARFAGPLTQTADQLTAGGGRAVAVAADVTDPGALTAAVEQISHQLGPHTSLGPSTC